MAKVLVFNLPGPKLAKLRMLLLRSGIGCRTVAPDEQSMSIGFLAGLKGSEAAPAPVSAGFSGEMLVMCDLNDAQFNGLLAGMRSNGISIPLKAVLTETNSGWDAARLYHELSAEHEEMMRTRGIGIHK